MKESISIKNLGPVKDVYIEEIRGFTVFIGKSGSGKSTIMKAIALFRWLFKMQNIRSYLKHSNISRSPFKFRMDTYLKNCGFEQFINEKTEIIYSVTMPGGKSYEIRYSHRNLSGTNDSQLVEANDISFNKISFISETRNVIPLWADKGARLAGGFLGFYFHEVYNDFEKATEAIKNIDIEFLDLKFQVRKTNSGKKYFVEPIIDTYREIDFKNSSSGTQTSIPVALITQYFAQNYNLEEAFNLSIVKYLSNTDKLTDFKAVKNLSDINKNIFIHVEEPELSLYPDAQCELINHVLYNCFVENKQNMSLMMSTHSPYIINHLNLLIKAFDTNQNIKGASLNYSNVSVYHVVKGELVDLKVVNQRLINTNPLSQTIDQIYDQYNKLDQYGIPSK